MDLENICAPNQIDQFFQLWLERYEIGCNLNEYRALYAIAHRKGPKTVLEIGPGWGSSTMAFLLGAPSIERLVQITLLGVPGSGKELVEEPFLSKVETHYKPSNEYFSAPIVEKFDLIFIDGDHSEHAVGADIAGSMGCLAPSGIILLHDTKRTCMGSIEAVARKKAEEYGLTYRSLDESGHGLGILY